MFDADSGAKFSKNFIGDSIVVSFQPLNFGESLTHLLFQSGDSFLEYLLKITTDYAVEGQLHNSKAHFNDTNFAHRSLQVYLQSL